jgi:hypothetical protein
VARGCAPKDGNGAGCINRKVVVGSKLQHILLPHTSIQSLAGGTASRPSGCHINFLFSKTAGKDILTIKQLSTVVQDT